MKYIMFENEEVGERPILFPDWMEHKIITEAMDNQLGIRPRSAGFVKFLPEGTGKVIPVCYGQSQSLKLHPHEDDEKIIEICLRR